MHAVTQAPCAHSMDLVAWEVKRPRIMSRRRPRGARAQVHTHMLVHAARPTPQGCSTCTISCRRWRGSWPCTHTHTCTHTHMHTHTRAHTHPLRGHTDWWIITRVARPRKAPPAPAVPHHRGTGAASWRAPAEGCLGRQARQQLCLAAGAWAG